MIASNARCPACGSSQLTEFFRAERLPVLCNVLWTDRDAARRTRRADVALTYCSLCGLVFNRAFDPGQLEYDARYENSLHFSPHFQCYADQLAAELVRKYDLHGKQLVEIGCGDGEFLAELCQRGENRGTGYDPSFDPRRAAPLDPRVRILPQKYSPAQAGCEVDFLCCRHVLEHLPDPLNFLRDLRETLGDRPVPVYFEVPNALYTLEGLGVWDILYEHVSYFVPISLSHLFRAAGFEVLSVSSTFGGQFLSLEARPSRTTSPQSSTVGALPTFVTAFEPAARGKLADWRGNLTRLAAAPTGSVIWGAGTKGITFLNLLQPESCSIEYVVDLNPRKQGKFVTGTGAEIISPEQLPRIRPTTVIVMNPNYLPEVRAELERRGVRAEVVSA